MPLRTAFTNDEPDSGLHREVLARYIILASNFLFPTFFALLLSIYFGSTNYGEVAPILALSTTMAILADFGAIITGPMILRKSRSPYIALRRTKALIIFRLKITLSLFIPAGIICASLFISPEYFWHSALISILSGTGAALSPAFYFHADGRMLGYATLTLVTRIVAMAAIIIVIFLNGSPIEATVIYCITPLILSTLALRQVSNFKLLGRGRRRLNAWMVRKSWSLGASAISANLATSLPFLLCAPWIPPEKMAWLHLGTMASRAGASLTEPIGMTLYSRQAKGTNNTDDTKFLIRIQGALGLGVTLISWLMLDLASTISYVHPDVAAMLRPLALLPLIISLAHLLAVKVLMRKNGQSQHLYANIFGLTFVFLGCIYAPLHGEAWELLGWLIAGGELAVLVVLLTNLTLSRASMLNQRKLY